MIRTRTNKPKDISAQMERIQSYSMLVSRMGLASKLGVQTFDGIRDIYEALGYPKILEFADFYVRYKRQDIANAIINRPVTATWQGVIDLLESNDDKETPLETAWKKMRDDFALTSIFTRLDKLTGIGEYGVLLFGMSDVQDKAGWSKPLSTGAKLVYLKPFSQGSAIVSSYVTTPSDPRYGQPEFYDLQVIEGEASTADTIKVHFSRVLHVVDGILESEVLGTPRLEPVFNRLLDIEKVTGGDAEMFWKGARPGYTGEVNEKYQVPVTLEDDMKDKLDEFEHGLRRVLMTEGVNYKALDQQVVDPESHVNVQLTMISAQTGIPKRILSGSERGELSSAQDATEWKIYIQTRRESYAAQQIIRPFVQRCQDLKILPKAKEEYSVSWPDLFSLTHKERTDIGKTRTDALKTYADSPMAEGIIPPEAFMTHFLGFTPEEIELIIEQRKQAILDEPDITPEEQALLDKEVVEKVEDKEDGDE